MGEESNVEGGGDIHSTNVTVEILWFSSLRLQLSLFIDENWRCWSGKKLPHKITEITCFGDSSGELQLSLYFEQMLTGGQAGVRPYPAEPQLDR